MSSELSVARVLAQLEARATHHREQQAFHTQQEAHHREQRALHEAELEKLQINLDAFRSVAAVAVELATQAPAAPPSTIELTSESGRLMVSRMIRTVVDSQAVGGEPFGGTSIAAETNKRFADRLRHPVTSRAVGDVLRRMCSERRIHCLRAGKAFYEALYGKGGRPAE